MDMRYDMEKRYERNHPAISEEEQKKLAESKAFVIGCGGLGGYIIELLARIGVGSITAVDADVFEPSNLNRQILSLESTLGKQKAEIARQRMLDVNSQVKVIPHIVRLSEENALSYVSGHDVVIDALDNIPARIALVRAAKKAGIPLVHGAIEGWRGRVTVVYPDDNAFLDILSATDANVKALQGNLGFTASCIASIEASEAVKILLGRGRVRRNILLEVNLLTGTFEEIPLTI